MSGENKDFDLDQLAFYSLDDLEQIYELESGEIIRDATFGNPPMITLCIHVPKDYHVCSVDISSIDQGYSENFKRKSKLGYVSPEEAETPQPLRNGEVVALVVERDVLNNIKRNWPNTEQVFFYEAYILAGKNGRIISYRGPKLSKPKRLYPLPLDGVPSHVLNNSDPSRARFVLYPFGTQLKFTENAGYTAPFRLPINKKDLLVFGSEFKVYAEKKVQQWELLNSVVKENDKIPIDTVIFNGEGGRENEDDNIKSLTSVNVNTFGDGVTNTDISLVPEVELVQKSTRDDPVRFFIRDAIEYLVVSDRKPTSNAVMKYLKEAVDPPKTCLVRIEPNGVRWLNTSGGEEILIMECLKDRLKVLRRNEPEIFIKSHYQK